MATRTFLPSRRLAAAAAALALAAGGLAACGDDDDDTGSSSASGTTSSTSSTADTTSTASSPDAGGKVDVVFDEPQNADQELARQFLDAGGMTTGVGAGFQKRFVLPTDLTIRSSAEAGSPNYDPSTKTLTQYYDFVAMTGRILKKGQPDISTDELQKQIVAVSGFILIHELAHALIDVLEIPITGREEDSADGLATVYMADGVKNGQEFAFDAARFFKFLQDNQGTPDARQFADEHSLSIQRALDIVCSVAGSSEQSLQDIASRNILPPERLQRCPAEYQQKSKAWQTLLKPHLRDG